MSPLRTLRTSVAGGERRKGYRPRFGGSTLAAKRQTPNANHLTTTAATTCTKNNLQCFCLNEDSAHPHTNLFMGDERLFLQVPLNPSACVRVCQCGYVSVGG